MVKENENLTEQSGQTKKSGKIATFIKNHKLVFSLLVALVVVFLWAIIKMYFMENSFEKQTAEMKAAYENKIDSLTASQLVLTSKVFSWAIRSELTRENREQVNQFFLSFIKEPGVTKVEYVDATTAKVMLSTDKKDEGTVFTDQVSLMTTETINFKNDSILNVISPVMGLNNKMGILIIEYIRK